MQANAGGESLSALSLSTAPVPHIADAGIYPGFPLRKHGLGSLLYAACGTSARYSRPHLYSELRHRSVLDEEISCED